MSIKGNGNTEVIKVMIYSFWSILIPLLLWYRIVDTETLIWRIIYFLAGFMLIDWAIRVIKKNVFIK